MALTPAERHADLLTAVDILGREPESSHHAIWQGIANDYTREEIVAFVEDEWTTAEAAHRKRLQATPRFVWATITLGGIGFVTTGVWLVLSLMGHKLIDGNWILLPLILINLCMMIGVPATLDRERSRGLAALLIHYGDARHIGFFVDALAYSNHRDAAKAHLLHLLPGHHASDAPPLDDYQKRMLLHSVKSSAARANKRNAAPLLDMEYAYMVVVLQYFERDAALRKALPGDTQKVLERLVATDATVSASEPDRWRPVHQAAEDCLVRVRGGNA